MALVDGKNPKVDSLRAKKFMISGLGSTLALDQSDSGATVVFDRAAGTVITLPALCPNGTFYEFVVGVTVTTNSAKVITGAATELLVGTILNCDTDTTDTVAIWKGLVGSSYIAVILGLSGGNTNGGIKGDRVVFTKINSTTWQVNGTINSTGTVVTPFSAS